MVLCKTCKKFNVNKFVFSSLATVYGDNTVPFVENMELLPTTNPYGETNRKLDISLSQGPRRLCKNQKWRNVLSNSFHL